MELKEIYQQFLRDLIYQEDIALAYIVYVLHA